MLRIVPLLWNLTRLKTIQQFKLPISRLRGSWDITISSQVKSSILFSQTASHLHIKIHIQNNVCRDGKAEKHSLSSCLPWYKIQNTSCGHRWFSARLQYLQRVSNGDAAVLHKAINSKSYAMMKRAPGVNQRERASINSHTVLCRGTQL